MLLGYPDNIEFIRRINGLSDIDEVRQIAYEVSYVVLGLGDVYLGAPVATSIPAIGSLPPNTIRPDLDSRECGRDRRGLPLCLRDGGTRRIPVDRPDCSNVEPLQPRWDFSRGSHGCFVSLIKSGFIRYLHRNWRKLDTTSRSEDIPFESRNRVLTLNNTKTFYWIIKRTSPDSNLFSRKLFKRAL